MSVLEPGKSVIVIGGGVIGVSTAVHLARGGAEVTLVTESELASGASGRSLSWLNSAGERSAAYHALRMSGIDRYRTLFAKDPQRDWLCFDGGLYWSAEEPQAVLARHAHERSHGYDSHLVDASNLVTTTPGVDPQAIGTPSIFNPGEGWVSLPELIEYLSEEFRCLGGRLVEHAGWASVLIGQDQRVRGVATSKAGEFTAGAVLVACGPQTAKVIEPLGVTIPDASPLSMLVLTEPMPMAPKAVLNTPRVAMRPCPGSRLALDHDWYEALIEEGEDGECRIDRSVVEQLVDEASSVLDGGERLAPASWKLGRKPIPGDGEPVFGELAEVPGCFVAFTHSGATLALIAGELLAGEILTGERHPMLGSFRPERFTRPG
ncbi:NAD(P)/FAD-dependent oxidoreductase [Halotalea alkalilenta]|uniref:NAD(P)/FAD-dependent oxidoreductase n=1 Tax=Halotalea alkalilenta TaxID=376489 RepID=UPI000488DBD2|nr:FAD-binding oxidoreductase [Halotalea alkalilenta]